MNITKIPILKNEFWYGGTVNDAYLFPMGAEDYYRIDLTYNDTYNQISPLLLSSAGRYVWLEDSGVITFDHGVIVIEAESVELYEKGSCLAEAYRAASAKHFKPSGNCPPEFLFARPQVCSWIATWVPKVIEQNQEYILRYAEDYIRGGGKPGLFIIDDFWQTDYGDWTFRRDKFPDARAMINRLHDLGFKVMVWLTPYVTIGSSAAKQLELNGGLLRGDDGELVKATWFDGVSYALDLSTPIANEWIKDVAKNLKTIYGVDAFKLDCGDSLFLPRDVKDTNLQNMYWAQSLDFDKEIIEMRACYKLGGERLIQRLADKGHMWGVEYMNLEDNETKTFLRYGLSSIIPGMLTQGLLGYYFNCPDMTGGGLNISFDGANVDNELLIRWCQAVNLMPMVQFSYEYWNSESPAVRECFKKCVDLREKFVPYILELASAAAKTGEPIVRYMEYEFPHCGLEKNITQFMLGDKYLVAPVIKKGQNRKTVFFPENTKWKKVLTDEAVSESKKTFSVSLDDTLIFERLK